MTGFIKRIRKKKWLIGQQVKSVLEIRQSKWIAVMYDDCDFIVMPSWWVMCLSVRRFMRYAAKGRLYKVEKNPYR